MKKLSLSDGEWKIMNLLWDRAPRTVPELVEALRDETGWTRATINMMLRRLTDYGAVRFEEGERARQFYPVIDRADTTALETERFLDRVYGGSLGLLLTAMTAQRALTREEREALQAILDAAEEVQS